MKTKLLRKLRKEAGKNIQLRSYKNLEGTLAYYIGDKQTVMHSIDHYSIVRAYHKPEIILRELEKVRRQYILDNLHKFQAVRTIKFMNKELNLIKSLI